MSILWAINDVMVLSGADSSSEAKLSRLRCKDDSYASITHARYQGQVGLVASNASSQHTHTHTHTHTNSSKASASDDTQQKVFDRIDASKLQGALTNASMLTNLEVYHHYLPLVQTRP